MKIPFSLSVVFVSIFTFGQGKEMVLKGDSLFIRDEGIATNPFNLGRDPLKHLTRQVKFSKPSIIVSAVKNRHVENDFDTTYAINFEQDFFNLYKWDKDESGLLSSQLMTADLLLVMGSKSV